MWIGLTREVPDPIGTWKWTLPGDSSFSYSNWDHGLCELFFILVVLLVVRNPILRFYATHLDKIIDKIIAIII